MEKTVGAHHWCIREAFATPLVASESSEATWATAEPAVEEEPFVPPDGTLDV